MKIMLLVLTKIVLIMGSYENDIILIKTYPKKKKRERDFHIIMLVFYIPLPKIKG